MHVHADIVVLVRGRLPRVQAHPDPHRIPARPVVPGQRPLRGHRVGRGAEHHEEAVPLGGDFPAAPGRDGRAHHHPVRGQRLAVPVTEAAQQHGRTLDITEQHRDSTRRQLPHPAALQRGQAHVPDRVGTRPDDHVVEEPLDGADEEVAYGDAEFTDEVVLAPFLVVLVVVPQGCQLAAQRADGGEPVRVGRRADPVAVQLQVREPVRDARPDRAGHGQRGEVPVSHPASA